MKNPSICIVLSAALLCSCGGSPAPEAASDFTITHGPMLGRVGEDHIGVWARTSGEGQFRVFVGGSPDQLDRVIGPVTTAAEDDFTGWTTIDGLESNSIYYYEIGVDEAPTGERRLSGHFQTLPSMSDFLDPTHNPDGLFNFRFEFGCGNNQGGAFGTDLPVYDTMLEKLTSTDQKNTVDFAILNGDWLYEAERDFSADAWMAENGLETASAPRAISLMPWIAGVWENYKAYLERAPNLAEWHRYVPSYYTFDDHEIQNDVYGTGEVGRKNSKAVFRDIAVSAFYDYLGWSNEVAPTQPIFYGKAQLAAGSDILTDAEASFSNLNLEQSMTLHVHWGTDAGAVVADQPPETGDPNANVYEIVEVLDNNRLRIRPAAVADSDPTYSIGRVSYFKKRVANVDFFVLDTRSMREMHDVNNPFNPEVSMIGDRQREWLMSEMRASDADFTFVVSSVNFAIPHIGGNYEANAVVENKDEAWTVFRHERRQLLDLWNELGKPVFVLTGDLHNSFAVRVSDQVWEFASGPHNSRQHPLSSEGNRSPNGAYEYQGQPVEIRWSTFALGDTPESQRNRIVYAVAQINNVWRTNANDTSERWVAYPRPQVVFQYYDGSTGELLYAESILAGEGK